MRKWLLVLAVLGLFLVGCEKPLSQSDVEKGFADKYEGVEYEIIGKSEFDKDDVAHDEASMILKARSGEVDFTMYSIKDAYSVFFPQYYPESDYSQRVVERLAEIYDGDLDGVEFRNYEKLDIGNVYVEFSYEDMNGLEQGYEKLAKFVRYALGGNEKLYLSVGSVFRDSLGMNTADEPKSNGSYMGYDLKEFRRAGRIEEHDVDLMLENLYQDSKRYYVMFSASHKINDVDYSLAWAKDFVQRNEGYQFSVIKDDEIFYWDDIFTYEGIRLPYTSFYDVLKRLDYDSLKGDETSFSFEDKDGKTYEFSDEFVGKDREINTTEGLKMFKSNYYLVDGEVKFFTSAMQRSLDIYHWGRIIGYRFVKGWHDEIPATKIEY
ncbi:MAG: hypothetical protein GXY87_05770 [Tissierellia bacterium]|nr:hypothetical protein [Tissierellia bacterium]